MIPLMWIWYRLLKLRGRGQKNRHTVTNRLHLFNPLLPVYGIQNTTLNNILLNKNGSIMHFFANTLSLPYAQCTNLRFLQWWKIWTFLTENNNELLYFFKLKKFAKKSLIFYFYPLHNGKTFQKRFLQHVCFCIVLLAYFSVCVKTLKI